MGGGVSSAAAVQMDEMMAYSVLLGKTITCMSFPGTKLTRRLGVKFLGRACMSALCVGDESRWYRNSSLQLPTSSIGRQTSSWRRID